MAIIFKPSFLIRWMVIGIMAGWLWMMFIPYSLAQQSGDSPWIAHSYTEEFGHLPLKYPLPEDMLPKTQKFPLKYKKSYRVLLPEEFTIKHLHGLIVRGLSSACVHNEFNQKRKSRSYVMFNRANGGIYKLDAAHIRDGNLFDPNEYGQEEMLYVFDKDATSQCRVYSIPYFR